MWPEVVRVTVVLGLLQWTVDGKPTIDEKLVGPCAGAADPMDCLHGILMHGDETHGEQHEAEDGYLKFKSNLATGAKAKVGPPDAEEMFHGVLMHGDDDTNVAHEHKDTAEVKPESPTKINLPQDIDEYMHGVLMHGDDEPGIDHKKDHQKLKGDEGQSANIAKGPDDLDNMMHKLMHKDGNTSHDLEKDGDPPVATGPDDLDNMMHKLMHKDGDISHDHDKDQDSNVAKGPIDLNNMMHTLMHADGDISHDDEKNDDKNHDSQSGPADMDDMMHQLMHKDGDISHEHDKDRDLGSKKVEATGPVDLEDMMHKMMHKDGDTSHTHDNKARDQKFGNIGPKSDDLHGVLMHGDKETGHVHEHTSSRRPFKMDKNALRELNIDEDILKSVGLESVLQDLEDYGQWKKNNAKKANVDLDDMGENILSDIEAMKKRYLQRAREVDLKKNVGITEKEALDHMKGTSGHEHEGDDATHNLELIGSTEPISDRHKVFKEGKTSDDL